MHKIPCAFTEIHKTWGADTDGVAFVQLSEICLDFMLSQADCLMALTTCFCPLFPSHIPSPLISPSFSLSLITLFLLILILSSPLPHPHPHPHPPATVLSSFIQRAAGQRRGRSSVPLQGVMGQVMWPAFTPTTAACQAVRTRTGFPRRVSFFFFFQLLRRWK